MSREELERFYQYASRLVDSGETPESLEAALKYWRSEQQPTVALPFPGGATLADRLEASGLLGVSDSCPADLSTNPAHFEGFGESWSRSSLTPARWWRCSASGTANTPGASR